MSAIEGKRRSLLMIWLVVCLPEKQITDRDGEVAIEIVEELIDSGIVDASALFAM